jgi:hypothetical protein
MLEMLYEHQNGENNTRKTLKFPVVKAILRRWEFSERKNKLFKIKNRLFLVKRVD